jgi:hypothetical protein
MSKQSAAKQAQGFSDKPRTCSNCSFRKFDSVIPQWMVDCNYQNKEAFAQDKNQRCSLGGFAVKKSNTCDLWKPLESPQ